MWNWFMIKWLKMTGRAEEAAERAMRDKHAIKGAYAQEANKIAEALNSAEDGLSTLMHEASKIEGRLERQRALLSKKERITAAAKRAALNRAKALGSAEAAKMDDEYRRHDTNRRSASAEVKTLTETIGQLEGDLAAFKDQIAKGKALYQRLERERQELKGEGAQMVMRLVNAETRKRMQNTFDGIGADRDESFRAMARNAVGKAEAEADLREELSGMSADQADDEYLADAASYETDSEMDEDLEALFKQDEAVEDGSEYLQETPTRERELGS